MKISIVLLLYILFVNLPINLSFTYSPMNKNSIKMILSMGYDTKVQVSSSFEAKCVLASDKDISLTNYMQLPVEQYVCIKMPLNAVLTRIDSNRFNLTVPPVRFFNFDVSPSLICKVTQSNEAILIESSECYLRGSPFVESLNGCFNMLIRTNFKWIDSSYRKSILSNSNIYVEVDPPAPFKYFGKTILENTGSLALSIALRQIENAFVTSLSKDYEKWSNDRNYRNQRAGRFSTKVTTSLPVIIKNETKSITPVSESISYTNSTVPVVEDSNSDSITNELTEVILSKPDDQLDQEEYNIVTNEDIPDLLTDDICLLPGDPIIRIEEAPSNSRRIYSGIDILAPVDDVWKVLINYERLQDVVPSLVKNEIVYRTADGGARLAQVGSAKVLPGITFTAKTVLDVKIYPENNPIPKSYVADYAHDVKNKRYSSSKSDELTSKYQPLKRGVFPRPIAITTLPHRDISMQNVVGEGDFDHYQGLWRMQELPYCAPEGMSATRLTYAVEIKPKGFLPVSLIESRIASDLKSNLEAIRKFVEKNKVVDKSIKPNDIEVKNERLIANTTSASVYIKPVSNNITAVVNNATIASNLTTELTNSNTTVDATTSDKAVDNKPFSFRQLIRSSFGFDSTTTNTESNVDINDIKEIDKLKEININLSNRIKELEDELDKKNQLINQIKKLLD